MTRLVTLALLALAVASGAGSTDGAPQIDPAKLRRARMMEDLMAGRGPIGGEFSLTAADGERRSLAEFRGKVVVLYFGYTFCPDVCPTDLIEVAALLRSLGADASLVQPIYVTIDPERDAPAQLAAYVGHFDARILPLTGSVAEVRSVAERYKAYFAKVRAGDSYLVEHSANFYVIDRQGRFAGSLPPGTKADRLAEVVRERLGGS